MHNNISPEQPEKLQQMTQEAKTPDNPPPVQTADPSFDDFGLHVDLLTAIADSGYTKPTPIQAKAIPVILQGQDVMGAAQTGTGKTAAFTLPVLHRIMPQASRSTSPARHPVRALILAPTRELADQVAENVVQYCKNSPLRTTVVFGGVDINAQKDQLRQGVELLIATPGRLLDHLEQKTVNLSQVSVLVLDEADRMLDMGFMPDLERIAQYLPKQRQNLMFSATFSPEIRKLARSLLNNPVEITVAAQNATAATVTQKAYRLREAEKKSALLYLLKSKYTDQVLIFVNTKIGASQLTRFLVREGVKADAIHGDKSQRERLQTYDAFKSGKLQVLVATDVAARGLDVVGLPCVINMDLPHNPEDYVHRIGRTGRAGCAGETIALVADNDEKLLADIEALTKHKIKREVLAIPEVFLQRSDGRSRSQIATKFSAASTTPIDDFFYKPYEATVGDAEKSLSLSQVLEQHKQQEIGRQPETMLPVLLGGGRKNQQKSNSS